MRFFKSTVSFLRRHETALTRAFVVVMALLLVTIPAIARGADPTDAAGVITAGTSFVSSYTMYVIAAFIVGIGLAMLRGLISARPH